MRALLVLGLLVACGSEEEAVNDTRVDVAGFAFDIETVGFFRDESGMSYGVITDLPGGCGMLREVATSAPADMTMLVMAGRGELPFTCELPGAIVPPACSDAAIRLFGDAGEVERDAVRGFVTFSATGGGKIRLAVDLAFPATDVDLDCRWEEYPAPCTCTPERGEPFGCVDDSGLGENHCCVTGVPWEPLRLQVEAVDCGVLSGSGG